MPTASPLSSSAAPDHAHQRDQRERRARSVPTTNATNAVSTTNIEGLLPCSTACSIAPCPARQTTDAMMAVAAPASPAAAAFRASRHCLRTSTTSATTARTKQATPRTTSAAGGSQLGMCRTPRDTSSATRCCRGEAPRMEPSVAATTRKEKTASSRSAGRRTRSVPAGPREGRTLSWAASTGLTAASGLPCESSPCTHGHAYWLPVTERGTLGRSPVTCAGKTEGRPEGAFLVNGARRCPTLPRGLPRSTIGAEGLNFRVRDGSGCFPFAVAAGTLWGCVRPRGGGRVSGNRTVDA